MANDNLHPVDTWLAVRQAWVAHLAAFAPLTELVSASRIYGEQVPSEPKWPFIQLGTQVSTPWTAYGFTGSLHRLTTHAFSRGPFTDNISRIASAVVASMNTFAIENVTMIDFQWIGTNVIRDGAEADGYHAIIDMDITATLRTFS